MSDNNLHKIFAPTVCVSTERMMAYINGTLSEKEKNSVEVHISSCEMCRDEFEGLSSMQQSSKLDEIVIDLNNKIDESLAEGVKKITFFKPIYRIAAAVVILIVSAWFLKVYIDSSSNNFSDEAISQAIEEVAKTENEEVVIQDTTNSPTIKLDEAPRLERIVASEGLKEIRRSAEKKAIDKDKLLTSEKDDAMELELMDEEIAEDEFAASTSKTIILTEKEAKIEDDLRSKELPESTEYKNIAGETSREKKKETEALDIVEEDVVVADYKAASGNNRKQNKKLSKGNQEQVTDVSNTVAINNFDLAMAQYNQREYKQAIELFKKSIKQHARTDEVYYYLAKSYYKNNETENALSSYNKVIAEQSSPYYEEALWSKSKMLLEINKKKSAINSFNQVKNYKGNYSERASQILDSLNRK